MRRGLAIGAVVAALIVLVVIVLGAGGSDEDGDYKVRAIFNNAAYLIQGEDVKVAGAKVGVVDDLEVTDNLRAAVVMRIDEPAFKDFRRDATCEIRLQSVIGEKLIECKPTQPRPEGDPPAPPLAKIGDGQDGEGQYLLPESQTLTPVGEDQIRDVMRLPYRQRFAIILNEFGTGLAARGSDLRKVIRGANPTLRELDNVIKILARQNKELERGVTSGDTVLAEWARTRNETADAIVQVNIAAQATAERRADLQRNFEKFPDFFRELRPTMVKLAQLSDQMLPTFRNLVPVADDVSRVLIALAPFSRAGIPALKSLGQTADVAGPALEQADPTIQVLGRFARQGKSLTKNLSTLLSSVDQTDGFKSFMSVILNLSQSVNGYDQYGHYLRTALLAGCNSLATKVNLPCTANFIKGASSTASSANAARAAKTPLEKILLGADPDKVLRQYERRHGRKLQPSGPASLNASKQNASKQNASTGAQAGGAEAEANQGSPAPASAPKAKRATPNQAVLNYLLGGDG